MYVKVDFKKEVGFLNEIPECPQRYSITALLFDLHQMCQPQQMSVFLRSPLFITGENHNRLCILKSCSQSDLNPHQTKRDHFIGGE